MASIDKLVQLIAKDFESTIKEEGFGGFTEMKECYCWTSQDIKDEVAYMVNHSYASENWAMLDDDDIYHGDGNGIIDGECSYRRFINAVYKAIKEDGLY